MNNIVFKLKSILHKITPNQRAEYFIKTGLLNAGEECELFPNVQLGSEPYLIKLGNKVRVAAGVQFITHDGGMWVLRNMGISPNADKIGTIVIEDNVFIGQNAVIMPGVHIGSNVVIGIGSIVTKSIPGNSVFAGIPAKYICSINEYYEKNKAKIDATKQMTFEEKKDYYIQKYLY